MNSKKTKRLGLFQFVLMAILFLLTLTMVVPLLHILARSLSDPLRSGGMNGLDILPKGLRSKSIMMMKKTMSTRLPTSWGRVRA